MNHKEIIFPDIDISHDEGNPEYIANGMSTPLHNADGEIYAYKWNGLPPGHYTEYFNLCVKEQWTDTVKAYETHPDDIYNAWWYIDTHPVFWRFDQQIHEDYPRNHVSRLRHGGALNEGWPDIRPYMVDPETGKFGDGKLIWEYEFGHWPLHPDDNCGSHIPFHDPELDGDAETYEQAIVAIAKKIHDSYGNDRRIVDGE